MRFERNTSRKLGIAILLVGLVGGCASLQQGETLRTVDFVDLDRFMGRWYIVAHTPTTVNRNAHNAFEEHEWRDDGRIATTYSFRVGSREGEEQVRNGVATVRNIRTNAEWDMRFMWPLQGKYRIVHLDANYRTAIIEHTNRRHIRILRRDPWIDPTEYSDLVLFLQEKGVDVSLLRLVPQSW